jgi:ABC-type cobalamin/Fe3+-siderophores transport system ATPase subunit
MLNLENLCVTQENKIILKDIDATIKAGKITTIIGPNGSGKSTLLKSIAQLITPKRGEIYLEGKNLRQLSRKNIAKKLAFMTQGSICPDNMTVKDLVMLGRFVHQNFWSAASKSDHDYVHDVINQVGLSDRKECSLTTLSGGQLQRAWMAMVLAQDTPYLLLDEPTTYLDLSYQIDLLNLIRSLNKNLKKTIVMVLHDLNHAIQYSDEIIVLHQNSLYAQGNAKSLITENLLSSVFKLQARVIYGIIHDLPYIVAEGTLR